MSEQYFSKRQESYEREQGKSKTKTVQTRRLQTLPHNRGYNLGIPKSMVKLLQLREHDLIKFSLDNQKMVLEKVNL